MGDGPNAFDIVRELTDVRRRAEVWGGAGGIINGHPVLIDDGRVWVDGRRVGPWAALVVVLRTTAPPVS